MPRYHFNIRNGIERPDKEGTALPSLEAARRVALDRIRAVMDIEGGGALSDGDGQVQVTNEVGLVLFTLILSMIAAPATTRS